MNISVTKFRNAARFDEISFNFLGRHFINVGISYKIITIIEDKIFQAKPLRSAM